MGKLPKKKTQVLAEKHAYGETLGRLKAETHFKNTQKGWWKSIREHVGKLIDNMDPLDLTAVLAGTIIVKMVIDDMEANPSGLLATVKRSGFKLIGLNEPSEAQFMKEHPDYAKLWYGAGLGELAKKLPVSFYSSEGFFPDWADWLIAFFISYLFVKHGGQIIGLLGDSVSGLAGFAKMMLA
jgi:hypothetical protein